MLQHIIRHSFAEREASSWLPTETAQTRNRSQQLSPEKAECPLPRTESVARRTPQRSQGPEPTPSRGERCATGRPAMEVCRNCTFSDVCRWQDIDAMHSQAPGDGRICAKCVLGRLVVARFHHGAFPGVNPWQVLRSMHPESGLGRENRQFAARFARHASEKGLACAPCIRNAPQIAVGGYTTRRSCQEGPLFAARAPRIMHGAQILPSFGAREERIRPKMPTFCQKLSPKDEKMSPKVLTSF